MPLIETEEAARRLARAIASDLSLYNEEKIVQGIQNDDLFTALAEEIEEGRALQEPRLAGALPEELLRSRPGRHPREVEGAHQVADLVAPPVERSSSSARVMSAGSGLYQRILFFVLGCSKPSTRAWSACRPS